MPHLSDIIIETPRLLLVPVDNKYAPDIFRESTSEIRKYMRRKAPKDTNETLNFIRHAQEQRENGEALRLTILNKITGEFIGGTDPTGLKSDAPRAGAWIKASMHSHGYGQEPITALAEWAKHNLTYNYLALRMDKRNAPSRKIAEALGGVIKKEFSITTEDGRELDLIEYWINQKTADNNK